MTAIVKDSTYPEELLARLKSQLKKMPVALHLLYMHYGINIANLGTDEVIETILNQDDVEVKFFALDIGNPIAKLDQEKLMETPEHDAMHQAWAIKFPKVYGADLYCIPYIKTEHGFAITAIIPANGNIPEQKLFFPGDLTLQFSITRMSKQV